MSPRRSPPTPYAPQARYILPNFIERTAQGFREYNPYAKLFEERIIFLGVQIDDASANDVMAQLLCLESMDPDRDITIYINSPGGSFTAMTAIYDTMQYIKPDIQTVCLGQAASAAAVLLAAGQPGKRFALPNSRILIHQPYTEGGGQASDIEIQANEILRMRTEMETILAQHTSQRRRAGPQGHRARQDPHRRRGPRVRHRRPGDRLPQGGRRTRVIAAERSARRLSAQSGQDDVAAEAGRVRGLRRGTVDWGPRPP